MLAKCGNMTAQPYRYFLPRTKSEHLFVMKIAQIPAGSFVQIAQNE